MTSPLVAIENLVIELSADDRSRTLVDGVSLDIQPGELVGLVGESGSGKSLTALSILKLLPIYSMSYPSGRILFNGQDMLNADAATLRTIRGGDIGCIFQEPMTSLNPLQTIEKQLSESLFLHRAWGKEKSRGQVLRWLERVGIREPDKKLTAYPHQLSGGERQRVMIAMALLNEPKLLIADEPTTALDVTVQAQILELIKTLQRELNMAVLFISHDLGVVKSIASRVAVMQAGRLVEVGNTDAVFSAPKHEYTQMLLDAEPDGEPVTVTTEQAPLLTGDQVRVWFPVKKGVLRRTVDHIKAVNDIAFSVRKGETLGIVGESGSGKSTLIKAILGLESFTGDIQLDSQSLNGLSSKAWQPLRKRMQIVFQDPYGALSPRMTVAQIIAEGLEIHGSHSAAEREQAVIDIMQEVGLDPAVRHRYPNEFSGGQRQRVAIARAMILQPEIVLLDEPTSSLDRTVQFQIIELLKKLQQQHQLTYLFISHDLKVVKSLAHEVIVMKEGEIVEQGKSVFAAPKHNYTKRLIETAFAV